MEKEPQITDLIDKIPSRDKEIIFLAPIFFWAKWMRREINTEGFKPIVPEVDFNDPISILRTGFNLNRQANSDIDGNVVKAVSDILIKHPTRAELFPTLGDRDIGNICRNLDEIFENQEFCAQCESWSFYDADSPEDFAISAAYMALWLVGGDIGLRWFTEIVGGKERDQIIEAVLKEKLGKKTNDLFLLKENKAKQESSDGF